MNPITWIKDNVTAAIGVVMGLALLGLGAWCMVLSNKLKGVRATLHETALSLKAEEAGHAVTRQSVAMLQDAIEAQNRDAAARADQYDTVRAADASDVAKADKALAGDKGRRDTLAVAAKTAGAMPGGCPVPEALAAAVRGL